MSRSNTATVETLVAEVRVLMVGSRQVTASVYTQLDQVTPDEIEPFGRVSPRGAAAGWVYVVGRHASTGALCGAHTPATTEAIKRHIEVRIRVELGDNYHWAAADVQRREAGPETKRLVGLSLEWQALPLIVLAGLR